MSHLRARARAAAALAASPPSPPAGTPAPSPSTALRLGLGPASPDDDGCGGADMSSLKSPAAAPRRRSLRLAGASGSSGSGSGSGGKRRGTARARAPAPPMVGSDGSGSGADGAPAGGGGGSGAASVGAFMSLRSGSRIAKRRMEAGAASPGGGGAAGGGEVRDEMPHPTAGTPTKRCRGVLAGGVEVRCVPDSESDSEEDCIMLGNGGVKMAAGHLPAAGPRGIDLNVVSTDMEEATSNGAAKPGNMEARHFGYPLPSPPSSPEQEIYADMYFKEDLRRFKEKELRRSKLWKKPVVKEKLVLGNNNARAASGLEVGGMASPDSKGKAKMVVEDSLSSMSSSEDESDSSSEDEPDSEAVVSKETVSSFSASMGPQRREAARDRAIKLAPKFAFFRPDKDEQSDEDEEDLEPDADPDPQDWPGPFSTAARIMEEREAKKIARELNTSKVEKSASKVIHWLPSKDRKIPAQARPAPSLTGLCLNILADNAEDIISLGGIPEELKRKLLKKLCHSRKMNARLLNELLCDSPTELCLSECSWLSEDDFEKTFGKCNIENLQDLQLEISGRCMPDYVLTTTIAKSPNCMPLLTKISLKGNYRLSDKGLETIVSAAPSLSSLNLCECSLLTSAGIEILADKLHSVIRELYIDDCTSVEAMTILPALQRVKHLEVLSMSGIQSVCDKFVNELIPVHGSNMRELAFAGCSKLTSSSIKTIGENCSQLSSLDLRNLNKLRDSAMRHLRNGCRLMKKLKIQRSTISDAAVSRYLEESGGCLTELVLNNVEKVGDLTALGIARKCSVRLEVLDLSFCRGLTNEALGLIADSCLSLRILKLFGCTQITDYFLKGHSNPSVKIVGIEGSILEHMDNH